MDYISIIKDIKAKKLRPVYFLEGEEPFFIDQIVDALDKYVLRRHERAFNFLEFYGKDTHVGSVLDALMRYPMMAERQLVIIKEAQSMRGIEELVSYVKNPLPTTILTIVYKNKQLDGRTKFAQALKSEGCLRFTSKRLYDNQLPSWIKAYVNSMKMRINDEEAYVLGEYLGTDLSKVVNELQKLKLNLPQGAKITLTDIEKHIGLSKDYNVFELEEALVTKNVKKTFRIVEYFGNNLKENSLVMVTAVLAGYFSKLYALRGGRVTGPHQAAQIIGSFPPFILRKYISASQAYSLGQLMVILEILHMYDLQSKGVGVRLVSEYDLMRQMISDILTLTKPDFSAIYSEMYG